MREKTIYSTDEITTALGSVPLRVVSLVPSTTETLITFGLKDRIIGVTDFCPLDATSGEIPVRIGGTKTVDVNRISELKPDLIIANQEENDPEQIKKIADSGYAVWLSFPKTLEDAVRELWTIVRIFNKEREIAAQIETLERSLEWTRLAFLDQHRPRYFCPIWKGSDTNWWMTFNSDTYAHAILACCGGNNIFSDRERRYPLEADIGNVPAEDPQERDVRYPRVNLSEIIAARPEVILLPSEPYAFNADDLHQMLDLLTETPAALTKRIHLFDGRWMAWHGIRMGEAIGSLPPFFHPSSMAT